jgi:hypothetical protein
MWTYDKALLVVRAYVDGATDGQGEIVETSTIDKPYGWVFFYQSRAFLGTGDLLQQFAGNAPVVFNRVSGEYRVTGTASPIESYLQEYEATLPAVQLEMKPQIRATKQVV